MNRSTKLLIAAVIATSASILPTGCNSGQQNANGTNNQNGISLTPSPASTPIPPAVACSQALPVDRANMVQQSLIQHINQTGGKLNEQYTAATPKFAFRAVVFPQGTNTGDPAPDGLILVVGGSILGKTIFPALNSLVAPYMAQQKCVMGVVFVAKVADVPPSPTISSLSALPLGFGWSGCEYPLFACPDGSCASSCSGGFGTLTTAAPAVGSSSTNTASSTPNTGSAANASSPPANRP